jgi:hypothetical protein
MQASWKTTSELLSPEGVGYRVHEICRPFCPLLQVRQRLLADVLVGEGLHVVIVVERGKSRAEGDDNRPEQHGGLLNMRG